MNLTTPAHESSESPDEQLIHHDGGCRCRSCEVDRYFAEQELYDHNHEKDDGPGYERLMPVVRR